MTTIDPLTQAMADRGMRQAHLFWHASREQWNSLSPGVQRAFVARFGSEWIPPRRSLSARDQVIWGDGAGRDFLWMHRQMITHANDILVSHRLPPLVGWGALPLVGDTEYPVPRGGVGDLLPGKDDGMWKAWLADGARFEDTGYLRHVTIDELGTQIEYGVHAAAHQRFGKFNEDLGPRYEAGITTPIDPKWDLLGYDSLLDPYAAHVHPWFWKLHGWIDSRIANWEKANSERVDWEGAWAGAMDHHHPTLTIDAATLDALASFFTGSGIGVGFFPRLAPDTRPPPSACS